MIQTLFGSLEEEKKTGFLDRMKQAVTRTRENLAERIEEVVAFGKEIEGGGSMAQATASAADAAEEGMRATTSLQARKGRASYLGPRSVGHQDPGATSSWLILKALADLFVRECVPAGLSHVYRIDGALISDMIFRGIFLSATTTQNAAAAPSSDAGNWASVQ